MASTDPKISSESSMPEWMKLKANPNTNFDTPFAQSPPAYEDSFFYIRYPNASTLFGSKQKDSSGPQEFTVKGNEIESSSSIAANDYKNWSKNTEPCYPNVKTTAVTSITSKPIAAGVDDGFKGEGTSCGSSIIKVAHQMIADQKVTQRGFTEAAINVAPLPEEASSSQEVNLGQYNLGARRGSKSLPASPSGSPTSRRKTKLVPGNRYFTGAYEVPPDIASSRSWIMAALLGQKRDMTYASTTTINEEEAEYRLTGTLSLAESVDNLGPKPTQKLADKIQPTQEVIQDSSAPSRTHKFRAKPTELREINFWSPTSM